MKVLYVVNNPAFLVSHRFELAKAAARTLGAEVHVAAPDGVGVDAIKEAGFVFHVVEMARAGLNPLEDLVTLIGLARVMLEVKPDIVHLVTIKPVVYGGIAARLTGMPSVVSAISGLGNLFIDTGLKKAAIRAMITRLYSFALAHPNSRTIVQNPDDRAFIIQRGLVDGRRVVLIKGSGCDTSVFIPRPPPKGPKLVLLAARLVIDKGVVELVEAARLVKAAGVEARFVLVGSVDVNAQYTIEEETLRGWVDEGVVEWWGYRSDMEVCLRQAHIACLPSYNEGLPKFLIEAASCGLPIVSTDVPGCREIARHEENALLVPARTVEPLADALIRVLTDEALASRLGQRGREMVLEEFSLAMVISKTLDLYEDLAAPSARARA